jgi:CheY-like chemotaxis protein
VLDYMMPRMNGAETAHLLKAMAPRSRIVAFSAVLTEKPEWADAFLDKARVKEIAPLLAVLAETRAPS